MRQIETDALRALHAGLAGFMTVDQKTGKPAMSMHQPRLRFDGDVSSVAGHHEVAQDPTRNRRATGYGKTVIDRLAKDGLVQILVEGDGPDAVFLTRKGLHLVLCEFGLSREFLWFTSGDGPEQLSSYDYRT